MTDYSPFFELSGTIAGTLIGLLFVAISVSPHDPHAGDTPVPFRIQTAAAFVTLLDALVVSLAALIPGDDAGIAALAASLTGLSTTAGLTVLSLRRWPGMRHLLDMAAIPFLAAAYIVQLVNSIGLLASTGGPAALRTQAVLIIFLFLIALERAWQLIGGRTSRLLSVLAETARTAATADRPPAGSFPASPPRSSAPGAAKVPSSGVAQGGGDECSADEGGRDDVGGPHQLPKG